MAAYTVRFMIHVTCRLAAKNRDQLRNPTLGNRVWANFTFLPFTYCIGNESVPKVIINDTVNLFFKLQSAFW